MTRAEKYAIIRELDKALDNNATDSPVGVRGRAILDALRLVEKIKTTERKADKSYSKIDHLTTKRK